MFTPQRPTLYHRSSFPLLGVLPDPAPMQSLDSPLEVCEARIRKLESLFASMSSYIEALESRVSSLEPLLPQAQRAELQIVETLAGPNAIEARVSLLEQVTAHAQFAHFNTHRGSAAAAEEEVTGRQGGRNRKSGQFIPKDPTADPQGQRKSICNGKQNNKCCEKLEISYPVFDEEYSDYSDKCEDLALIRDVDQLKSPAVPGLREIIPSRSD
jgi:hypothetical protein